MCRRKRKHGTTAVWKILSKSNVVTMCQCDYSKYAQNEPQKATIEYNWPLTQDFDFTHTELKFTVAFGFYFAKIKWLAFI